MRATLPPLPRKKKMIHLNLNKLIYRPIREIFDFISTPENDFQWQYGTLASAWTSESAKRVGASFRSIGHFLGRRTESTYEITDYEPIRKYGFKSLSGPRSEQHTSELQ